MIDNPTIGPGSYDIEIGNYDDVEKVSVTTNVVPKPPPRICVDIVVERKPPAASSGRVAKKRPSSR